MQKNRNIICFLSPLTLPWRRSLSYRPQFIDLLCKSIDWVLYDRDLRHENVKLKTLYSRPILGPFCPLPLTKKVFCQNHFIKFLAFTLLWLHAKSRKSSTHRFLIILEKAHFGPISGQVSPKTLKTKIFTKKVASVNFKPLCYCNVMQKIRKVLYIDFHNT